MLCFGRRKPPTGETEPLLSHQHASADTTSLQSQVHSKLHTYQMVRALQAGYLPSTAQLVSHLRALLATELLDPTNTQLSTDGRRFVKQLRKAVVLIVDVLEEKNGGDQVQEFFWCVGRARVELDMADLGRRVGGARERAEARAAYDSLQTVFDLLLANNDFRKLLADVTTLTRRVLSDTAAASATATLTLSDAIAPSAAELNAVTETGPTRDDVPKDVADAPVREVAGAVAEGVAGTVSEAIDSAQREFGEERRSALFTRMRMAVMRLRANTEYTESVGIVAMLIKRYAYTYSRALETTTAALGEDLQPNPELDRAMRSFGGLVRSFGDAAEWDELSRCWGRVVGHIDRDVEFESVMDDLGSCVQAFLTDPDFVSSAEDQLAAIRAKIRGAAGAEGTVRGDVDALLGQACRVYRSIARDIAIARLLLTLRGLLRLLFPHDADHFLNPNLTADLFYVLLPLALKLIQHIPIPRLTIATPELDLLLENLVLEPGSTINNTSFLPFRLRIESRNDVEILKGRQRTTSSLSSSATIKLDGITLRATDIGYWLSLHSGPLLKFHESGLASFAIDGRGLDIHLDISLSARTPNNIVTLNSVTVKIHTLSYTLRHSHSIFSFAAWLLKPLLRPILRRALETFLASTITAALKAADTELLFARERLRATRIAEPKSWRRFFAAVMARFVAPVDPDVEVAVGIMPPGRGQAGVFEGVRTPASLLGLWEEGERTGEVLREEAEGGWRNAVFDVLV